MTFLPPPESRRPLGKSGLTVSALAWGNWRLCGDDVNAVVKLLHAALEAGIDLIDTADIYGPDNSEPFGASEALLGRALATDPALRDKFTIATKGGISMGVPYDSSAGYLTSAIDASLQRLGTDRVELWQIHRPDILTHPSEIAEAVTLAHKAGKIRSFGVSNFTVSQIATLQQFLDLPIVSTQPEFSPLKLAPIDNGELDQAIAMDMAVLAWSPLGGGRIANPSDERATAAAAALDEVAEEFGVSRTAAAYSWIMAHPARPIPIVGSQKADRIAEAADALKVRWTRARWYGVLVAAKGEPLP
ncbi:putative oxidoreductase [Novosphingobium chloroacetimidivorans]|uniref:Putative oxidoreductase n=1 Tax=Novosphingobium chloroacetimidivorans TaxID=1428314 RepID=A0A7W7NVI5_9SPHN|nr:aldo/keto reductase [Novosphingobium chloroacetimidivorans]MBB4858291.1 putative oxidoreductase [Novosphingobium chloroacetimidivorans]